MLVGSSRIATASSEEYEDVCGPNYSQLNSNGISVIPQLRKTRDEGIGNVTPAEKCGVKINGEDKWATIIQNAKKNETK